MVAIVVCIMTTTYAAAQDSVRPHPEYTISIDGGATIPNTEKYSYIGGANFGVSAAINWQMTGERYWIQFWKQPRFGLYLEYLHSTNSVAGERIAISASMQNAIWRSNQSKQYTSEVFWYTGAGVALYTNPYERTQDTMNCFIGSYLNCIFNLGAGYSISFPDHSALTFSLRFSHSSNGYLLKPNQGLNYLMASVGYRLSTPTSSTPTQDRDTAAIQDRNKKTTKTYYNQHNEANQYHRIWASFAPAVVQSRWYDTESVPPKHKHYFAYTAQLGYMYYINQCLGFGANLDVMYNYSHIEMIEILYKKEANRPYLGACLDFEPRWGDLSVRLSAGYYIIKSEVVEIPFYEHLGVFYHFGKKLSQFAGVTIKAHAAHADYIEWHYGIELFINQPKRCVPAQGEVIL